MALPQTQERNGRTVRNSPPPFVKVFASPGIDSSPNEFGVIASGAGMRADAPRFKINPWDWGNDAPTQDNQTEHLVGGYAATKAPDASNLKIRRRGVSPWGGKYNVHPHSMQHTGGNQDMNPGADFLIAGGKGQASSFVRLAVDRTKVTNQGMKLPTLPQETTRAGAAPFPTGGSFDASPAAPVLPRMVGWPTIFAFRTGVPR